MKRWKALTSVALTAALVIAPLVSTGANAAEPTPTLVGAVGELQPWSSDTNKTSYWESQYKEHKAACYSAEGDNSHGKITDGGKTVTLNTFDQSWPGDHWEVLIVKGGSVSNNVIVHPAAGVAYASPLNDGGKQSDVSHWIVCKGTTPVGQPKVITPSLDFKPASCDAAGALTQSSEGVNWAAVLNDDGSTTYTASAKSGYTIAENATVTWTVPNLAKLPADSKACKPPVLNSCEPGVGALSTDLHDLWSDVDTRSKGHSAYVAGGLHVWTDDNSSNAKVSEGVAADFALKNTGVLDINATANPGNDYQYGPGLNLFVDFDNDGDVDGTLVYEEVYGQDLWLTNGSADFVRTGAPSHTGGNGSTNHGTINEWLSVFPDAKVKGVAYTLGSGVHGDWTITSIVFNCSVYTFDKAAPQPPVKKDVSSECSAPGKRTITHTETAYVWDAAKLAWVLGTPVVVDTKTVADVLCVVLIDPVPPVWVDDCGPNNGYWSFPGQPNGYTYVTWTHAGYRYALLIPKLFDGQLVRPGSEWLFKAKDSNVACDSDEDLPVPALFAADPSEPTCATDGALPDLSVQPEHVSVTISPAFAGPGTYTVTATTDGGFEFTDGTTVKVRDIQVAAKTGYQSVDKTAECYLDPQLVPGVIASECVGSVPYLGYAVTLPEGYVADSETPVTITFVHPTDPTQNYVVTGQPLSGTLLWPGASAGTPQQWPGWVHNADGTYSETDGNYAWTRAAAGIMVRFDVNPTYSTVVTYPPESALCADPASAPVKALPATGGTDMTAWGIAAAIMLIAGAALIVTRRRLVRR